MQNTAVCRCLQGWLAWCRAALTEEGGCWGCWASLAMGMRCGYSPASAGGSGGWRTPCEPCTTGPRHAGPSIRSCGDQISSPEKAVSSSSTRWETDPMARHPMQSRLICQQPRASLLMAILKQVMQLLVYCTVTGGWAWSPARPREVGWTWAARLLLDEPRDSRLAPTGPEGARPAWVGSITGSALC